MPQKSSDMLYVISSFVTLAPKHYVDQKVLFCVGAYYKVHSDRLLGKPTTCEDV